jgi:hypothetical protein
MHEKKFNSNEVLDRLLNENFNLFMAVPTIYGNLANYIR